LLAYINQYHITEQTLLEANVGVINRYNRFLLPKLWGSGQRASADGTKWDVYEQNLLRACFEIMRGASPNAAP